MRKIISFALAIVLLSSMVLPALAVETSASKIVPEVILEMDNVRIEYYEDDTGEEVLLQYVDDVLTQKNTISKTTGAGITREFFENGILVLSDTLANTGVVSTVSYAEWKKPTPRIGMGTINYCTVLDTGSIYYGLSCSCEEYVSEGEYTINGYLGPVIDLAAIIASNTNIKAKIATLQIQAIAIDIGILIVAGVIKERLITTVSCNRHDFVWILTDTTNTMHRKNVTGASYYTYDTASKKTRAYFEGYTPRDWGTSAMATWFHNEMFAYYDTWHVVSWS